MVQKASDKSKGTQNDDGWIDLPTERYIWSPELSTESLQGYLLDIQEMPAGKMEQEWYALIVRTTAPAEVKDPAKEGEKLKVPAGVEVLVPMTERLKTLTAIAENPLHVWEIRIKPAGKLSLGGGKSMWRYDAQIKKEPVSRDSFGPMFQVAPPPPQLPQTQSDTNGYAG